MPTVSFGRSNVQPSTGPLSSGEIHFAANEHSGRRPRSASTHLSEAEMRNLSPLDCIKGVGKNLKPQNEKGVRSVFSSSKELRRKIFLITRSTMKFGMRLEPTRL
jgi:hypothetical protein